MDELSRKGSVPLAGAECTTLVELLRWRATLQADQKAYTFLSKGEDELSLTYAQLDRQARAIGAMLQGRGATGERVLLLYPAGLEYIAAFFGCLYAGALAVPAYPPHANRSLGRIESIIADAQATFVLTTSQAVSQIARGSEQAPSLHVPGLQWIATERESREKDETLWQMPKLTGSTIAFLQYTSGSTATPKGVMISHSNLLENHRMIQSTMGHPVGVPFVSWLPLFHDMGLISKMLQALYMGSPCILLPPSVFLQAPFRWLEAISLHQAYYSGAPNFAYDWCVQKITPQQRSTLNLSSWKVAFCGAEPIRSQTLTRFAEYFAPCGFRIEALKPVYGLAEATVFVTGHPGGRPPVAHHLKKEALEQHQVLLCEETTGEEANEKSIAVCTSCGKSELDGRVVIVEPGTCVLSPVGKVGEIWIAGSHVAQGYWNRKVETEATFHAFLKDTGEGPFLRTGDLGFLLDGNLFVTGRLKDMLIIQGHNHYPQDLEQTAQRSHVAVRPQGGAAFSVTVEGEERVVLVQEVRRESRKPEELDEICRAIRQAIAEEHDLAVSAIILLRYGSLPKTSSGKVQRSACRSRFLEGTLHVVYEWVHNAVGAGEVSAFQDALPTRLEERYSGGSAFSQRSLADLMNWLVAKVAALASVNPSEVDPLRPFSDYGLGSTSAISAAGDLERWLGLSLSPTLLYDYPTISSLAHYLQEQLGGGARDECLADSRLAPQPRRGEKRETTEPIAIIGLGCRFPGAESPEAFWQMLQNGIDGISEVPATRWDATQFYAPNQATPGKMNTRWGGFLQNIEQFDPAFFHIAPREAAYIDPQQRLLLEVAWETLENAGQAPDKLAGSQTGVFIGISSEDYLHMQFKDPGQMDTYTATGGTHSIAANRLSYTFDLRGLSITTDTACSSSLVAVHQACQSLRLGECDLALAGGVNVILTPEPTIIFSQIRTMSAKGRCKTFDASADGYVRGEGCGLVLLKPLAAAERDGDTVLAIIRGSAVNQDGRSNGLTAPNGPSQEAVIRHALYNAGVHPSAISYVETHGSSTPLGDPIEVEALKAVLMQERSSDQPCLLGAVKTNIGHLEAAAGIAGLIKTVLCLQKGIIAPNLHFSRLNPHISFAGTTFEIPREPRPWPGIADVRRFAGVSSFGFGGTNAHVILESVPCVDPTLAKFSSPPLHLLTLSGRTAQALSVLAQRYQHFLTTNPTVSLADLCATAHTGRTHFAHRLAMYAENTEQLREQLAAFVAGQSREEIQLGQREAEQRQIAFLFPGQGCQYVNMAQRLYETEPTFRATLDECDRLLRPLLLQPMEQESCLSLLSLLYPASSAPHSPIHETAYTQPALFALEYALAQMWFSWGVKPDVVMGHSMGEYVAACVAGLFSLEDGLKLITARGRLMQALPEHGAMAVIFAEPGHIQTFIQPYVQHVSIAAFNGPNHTVISGREEIVHLIVRQLEAEKAAKGIAPAESAILTISQASHCPLVDPMLDAFEQVAREVTFLPLRLPLVCNLTGQLLGAGSTLDAGYWRRHTREPVQFATGIQTLAAHGCDLFLELGPTPVLSQMGRHCLPENAASWLTSLRQDHKDWQVLLQSLASLYCKGYNLDWSGFEGEGRKITLPTSPFEREYCWFNSQETGEGDTGIKRSPLFKKADTRTRGEALTAHPAEPRSDPSTPDEINLCQLRWEAIDLPTLPSSMQAGYWIIFLDQKGVGQRLAQQLQTQGHTCCLISSGENFQIFDLQHFQANPAKPREIKQAVGTALAVARTFPLLGVLHLWSLDTTPVAATTPTTLEADQILGVQSALSLIQSLVEEEVETRLWFITQGAQPIPRGEQAHDLLQEANAFPYADLAISQAPLWGLGKTCAMEHPELWSGLIDLDPYPTEREETETSNLLPTISLLMTVLQGDPGEKQLALRGAKAYAVRIVQADFGPTHPLYLSQDGAYLITGGMSGLGLECARWLATQGVRHLILLGRTWIPTRETWDQIPPESRQGMRIADIRSLERLGVQVHVASVDVTDEAQIFTFLDLWSCGDRTLCQSTSPQQEMPPIRGLIHAASVWRDEQGQSRLKSLANLNAEDLMSVLRPKMLGGWLLAKWFQETPLDFFVSFSSAASLFGSEAQGNYAAANEFLDALSYYQRAHGQLATSIDWGAISEIGSGAAPEVLRFSEYWESHGMKHLSLQQVLAALELLLSQNLARVGVLRLDWQLLQQFYPKITYLPLDKKDTQVTGHERTHRELLEERNNGRGLLQTLLEAPEEEQRLSLTAYIQEQTAHVLRLPTQKLDCERPLTTLGFDSLMAIELRNRLDRELQIRLPLVTLLRGTNITQLVDQLLTLETPWTRSGQRTAREAAEASLKTSRISTQHELPLSHNQKALWFLSHLAPESTASHLLYAARVRSRLDSAALQRALRRLSERYPILTATYPLQNGEPVQWTRGNQHIPLEEVDATSTSLEELSYRLSSESHRPIDLTKGPVLRLKVYRCADDDAVLGFFIHHIVTDLWALKLLVEELSLLYAVEKNGVTELPGQNNQQLRQTRWQQSGFQHADYVRWQQSMLGSEIGEQHWQYWQKLLAGDLPVLSLPLDRPRPPVQTYKGAVQSFSLGPELVERLRQTAKREKVTLFTLMLAAYQVLLYRYTQQDDILVGTPALGRTRSELEHVIGSLTNIVIVRARFESRLPFKALLDQTKRAVLEALEHQDFPFPLLVKRLQLYHDPSYSPLYQTLFIWDHLPTRTRDDRAKALFSEPFAYGEQGAPTDLVLTIFEREDQLAMEFRYNVDLFDAGTLSRMAQNFLTLLDSLATRPDQSVTELPLLPDNVRQMLLVEWNATDRALETVPGEYHQLREMTLRQLFEQQVERTPDALAVVASDEALTFSSLDQQANRLAHLLLGLTPQGSEPLVGISLERSPEMLVSILAVFKAGGAYLPLDPSYPEQHVRMLVQESQIHVILTQPSLRLRFPQELLTVLVVQCPLEKDGQETGSRYVSGGNLAYVIYTSGSTGKPKGAMVTQRGMVNHLFAKIESLQLNSTERVAQTAPASFDISVWQFLAALLVGGQVCIFPDEVTHDPGLLLHWVSEQGVTVLELVPSFLQAVLDNLMAHGERPGPSLPLHWLLVTGEACPTALVERWQQHSPQIPLMNAYGPTECSDDVTHALLTPFTVLPESHGTSALPSISGSIAPIGRPIANTQIYLLDRHLQPLPIGIPGEIYIGGMGLGRGYLSDPVRTALAFVPHPFGGRGQVPEAGSRSGLSSPGSPVGEEGERLYRTGDLGRYLATGQIEFIGRVDSQVKLRGYRIELGAIEATLRAHPAVQEAMVVLQGESELSKMLVAYVVPVATPLVARDLDLPTVLQEHLRQHLPDYMVPTRLVELERLPLLPNGKVDRSALPSVDSFPRRENETGVAPSTPLQELLGQIWCEVLHLREVGIHEHFFQLGGHSLLVTQVVSRIRQTFQVDLPLRTLFEAPTLALLSRRLEEVMRGSASAPVPALVAMERGRDLPLSFAQERLWFLHQWEPDSPWYNVSTTLRLCGLLDMWALESSLNTLVQRHEILRTTFEERMPRPVQVIAPTYSLWVPVVDLSGLVSARRESLVRELQRFEMQHAFDLSRGPLMRICLLRLDCGREATPTRHSPQVPEHVLLFTLHHIVCDGWSMGVMACEITQLYQARRSGKADLLSPLPIQYADYTLWQRQWLQGEVLDTQLAYWRKQLRDLSPLILPTDHPRPRVKTERGANQSRLLPKALAEDLLRLCQQHDVTPFMLLLSAFQVLLMRYTGRTDISVGTPIANRRQAELEGLIGFFVNTLVMRTDLGGNPPFVEVLGRVREVCLSAYVHQDIPFEKVVEELGPERDLSRSPLFQVMLVLQNSSLGMGFAPVQDLAGVRVMPLEVEGTTSKFDLTLFVTEVASGLASGGLNCMLEYSTDLFEASTITRMLDHFQTLLSGIVQDPQARLSGLPLLTDAEREQLLVRWNATQADYRQEMTLHQLLENQVEQTPESIAVFFEGEALTYAELNREANRLAHHLQRLGVGTETLVGICLPRCLQLLISILSVFLAGGAYLPLDPKDPEQRLRTLVQQSQIGVLLTSSTVGKRFRQAWLTVLDVDERDSEPEREPDFPTRNASPHLAYVIYTSGSTGVPKGAMLNQGGMLNHLLAKVETLQLCASDRLAVTASPAFDISVWQLLSPLLVGGQVSMVPDEIAQDPASLLTCVHELAITVLELVPSVLQAALEARTACMNDETCALRWLLVTGEACQAGLLQRFWQAYPKVGVVNAYGPTECSDDVTHALLHPGTLLPTGWVPLGGPIANTQIYLLDARLSPVPIGVPGEIWVGGRGVGRGYLADPARTAQAFVPNPFARVPGLGERLYRTGDLGRWETDGSLHYLGRMDHQVKLRGVRIELGEIETSLLAHPAVQEAVVLLREEDEDRKYLVAYVVARSGASLEAKPLQEYLHERLSDALVPTFVVFLESMPRLPNGKVDRKALPVPERTTLCEEGYVAPQSELEQVLSDIWEEVLGLAQVGTTSNFFELGGHSLLATRLVARLRAVLNIVVPLRVVFEAPTIAELARRVESLLRRSVWIEIPPLVKSVRTSALPLSFAQQRLWFLDQLEPESTAYLMPAAYHLRGEMKAQFLDQCLQELVCRHEILRTTFALQADQPVQVIHPVGGTLYSRSELVPSRPRGRGGSLQGMHSKGSPLRIIDLQGLGAEQRTREAQKLAEREFQHPMCLSRGPLLRMYVLRMTWQEHMLLLTLHHIITDGWSNALLLYELATLYRAFLAEQSSPLSPLALQYADYALWQRQWLQGKVRDTLLDYWIKQLKGAKALELPTDRPRATVGAAPTHNRGAVHPFTLPSHLGPGLTTLSQEAGVTLFMTLLTAFQIVLSRTTGVQDVVVGTDVANRASLEMEEIVGFFVNLLVLRVQLSGQETFRQTLRKVAPTVLAAYAHQDLPFEQLVDALQFERNPDQVPLVNVLFVLQNVPQQSPEFSGLEVCPVDIEIRNAKFDVALFLMEQGQEIIGSVNYRTDLFEQETIATLVQHFTVLLQSIVTSPDIPIELLEMLSEKEKEQCLKEELMRKEEYYQDLKMTKRQLIPLTEHDFESIGG